MKSLITLLALMLLGTSTFAEGDSFQALRDGDHVLLLRHAIAPGFGDPAGIELDDCATQRNLSEEGRQQARAIGGRLRAEGLGDAAVYTSEWCRGRDTAEVEALFQ